MEDQVLSAAANPALANKLIAEALKDEAEPVVSAKISIGQNVTVHLPGGYKTFSGEVVQVAEVKELTGRDEEAIARAQSIPKIYSTVLQRGVVSLGGHPVNGDILNDMLIGDREALLLGIYRATYGDTADLMGICNACGDIQAVQVDLLADIKYRPLLDPYNDRTFEIFGRNKTFLVTLPTGLTETLILENSGNNAEKVTILLEQTVLQINGSQVISRSQVQDLGMSDRKLIVDEMTKRAPGPLFENIVLECPKCGDGELTVPISIGALFRF